MSRKSATSKARKPTGPKPRVKKAEPSAEVLAKRIQSAMSQLSDPKVERHVQQAHGNTAGLHNRLKQYGVDVKKMRSELWSQDPDTAHRGVRALERSQMAIERDRVKRTFGEDIGGPQEVKRKPRNRSEAARKAARTRKLRGK